MAGSIWNNIFCESNPPSSGSGYTPSVPNNWGQTPPSDTNEALDFLSSIEFLNSGSVYFVSKTGNDANSGSRNAPFLTIQAAINACYASASENCVIMILDDGEYNEQLDFGNMFPRKNIIFKSAVQTEFITSIVSRPKIWYDGDLILGAPDTSIPARIVLEFEGLYLQGGVNIQASVDNCQIHLVLNKCLFIANNYPITLKAISGVTLNGCAAVDFGNITCTNIAFFTSNDSHVWEYTVSAAVVATFINDGTGVYVNTSDKQISIDISGRKSDLSNLNKLFRTGVFNIDVQFSIINGGSPINFTASNEVLFRTGNTITIPEFVNFSLLGCRVNSAIDIELGASCELVNTYLLDDLNNDGTLIARSTSLLGSYTGTGILDQINSDLNHKALHSPNIYYVSLNGNDLSDGSYSSPFQTPQAALDAVISAGQLRNEIRLFSGTYNSGLNFGNLTVQQQIVISAVQSGSDNNQLYTVTLDNLAGDIISATPNTLNNFSYITFKEIRLNGNINIIPSISQCGLRLELLNCNWYSTGTSELRALYGFRVTGSYYILNNNGTVKIVNTPNSNFDASVLAASEFYTEIWEFVSDGSLVEGATNPLFTRMNVHFSGLTTAETLKGAFENSLFLSDVPVFNVINGGRPIDVEVKSYSISKPSITLPINQDVTISLLGCIIYSDVQVNSGGKIVSYSSSFLGNLINNGEVTLSESNVKGTISGSNPPIFKGMLTNSQKLYQPNLYYIHSVYGDNSYKGSQLEPRLTLQSIIDDTIGISTEETYTLYLMDNGNQSLNFDGSLLQDNKIYNIVGNPAKDYGCGSITITNDSGNSLTIRLIDMRITNTVVATMTTVNQSHISLEFLNCNISSPSVTMNSVKKIQFKDSNLENDLILNNVGYAFFDQSSISRAGVNACQINSDGSGLWNSNTTDQTTRVYVNGSRNSDLNLLQESNPFNTGYMSGVAPVFTTQNGGSIYMGVNGEILFYDWVEIPSGMQLHCVGCYIKSDFTNNGQLTLDSTSTLGVITGNTPLFRTATENAHEYFRRSEFYVHPTLGDDGFLGSLSQPKATLQAAVDECYSLGYPDNYIYFDGEIDEEVTFGDATHDMNIHIFGKDKVTALWTNSSGDSIATISNNDLNYALQIHLHNFKTDKTVQASSDTQGSYVDLYLDNVNFNSSNSCDLVALRYFAAEHCIFNCDLTLKSCWRVAFTDSAICTDPGTSLQFIYDDDVGSITHPESGTDNFMTVDISGRTADLNIGGNGFSTGVLASMTQLGNIVNTGEIYVKISAEVLFDSANTLVIDSGVYLEAAGCKFLSAIQNDGSLVLNFATVPNGITGSGTTVINEMPFIPANPLDWGSSVPDSIEQALNILAANVSIP